MMIQAKKQPSDSKLIIASCIKNNEKWNDRFLDNLDNIASYFSEVIFIFVEDGSTDSTKEDLQYFKKNGRNVVIISGESPILDTSRVRKMARIRNLFIDHIKTDKLDVKFDYILIIDSDEIGSELWTFNSILSNFKTDEQWDMICANQPKGYYDVYAYRGPKCDYDCWKVCQFPFYGESKADILRRCVLSHFSLTKGMQNLLRVQSAFGGAAFINLYDGKNLPKFNEDCTTCEWVDFCAQYENIFINPEFINFSGVSHHIHDCYALIGEHYEEN